MGSPGKSRELLDAFLDADLARDEALAVLKALTGRGAVALGRGVVWLHPEAAELAESYRGDGARVVMTSKSAILTGQEQRALWPGMRATDEPRHIVRGRPSRRRFVDFYRNVQRDLSRAQTEHARDLKRPKHQRLGFAFPFLDKYTDDIRPAVARRVVTRPGRGARKTAIAVLSDPPLRREDRTLSLVGELALAMFEKIREAVSAWECPYCDRWELYRDPRERKKCNRTSCTARYGREWRQSHPEDKAQVARRMKRHRQKVRTT
jgi:hypothetical protein